MNENDGQKKKSIAASLRLLICKNVLGAQDRGGPLLRVGHGRQGCQRRRHLSPQHEHRSAVLDVLSSHNRLTSYVCLSLPSYTKHWAASSGLCLVY